MCTASSAICCTGWRTEVSSGSLSAPKGVSSKPVTAMSPRHLPAVSPKPLERSKGDEVVRETRASGVSRQVLKDQVDRPRTPFDRQVAAEDAPREPTFGACCSYPRCARRSLKSSRHWRQRQDWRGRCRPDADQQTHGFGLVGTDESQPTSTQERSTCTTGTRLAAFSTAGAL